MQAAAKFEPFQAGVYVEPLSDDTLQEIPGMFVEGEFVIIQQNNSVGIGNKVTNTVTVNSQGVSRAFNWSNQGSLITFVDFLFPVLAAPLRRAGSREA